MNRKQRKTKQSGFSAFYAVAIPFLVLGITTSNPAFIGAGVVFIIMGISETRRKKDKTETLD